MNHAAQPAETPRPILLNAGSASPEQKPAGDAERLPGALAVGLDIECAEILPSGDPRSEPFYLANFTRAEIEWCLRQGNTRSSFCGLWSAKEAAIKCCHELAAVDRTEIEVRHDARGRPMLHATRASHQRILSDCALSISHAGGTCLAVCVRNRTKALPCGAPIGALPS